MQAISLFRRLLAAGVDALIVFFGLGFAVALGALSGVIPAFRAARLDPVLALRTTN